MKIFKFTSLLLAAFFLAFGSNFSSAQTVAGKVFLKDEADKLFGPVKHFVKLPTLQFESLLSKTGENLMFRFEGVDLYILNSKKVVLFSANGYMKNFSAADSMKFYSISVIKELLDKGQSSSVTIEQRESVMSVTDGNYTMEEAQICPPNCPPKD